MVYLRRTIRRGLARSAGQIVVSVLATVIATSLYPVIRQDVAGWLADPAPTPVARTDGGKYAARIDGAAFAPAPPASPGRPALSIVNWAMTPTRSPLLIDDVAWDPFHALASPATRASTKPVRVAHEARRLLAADVTPMRPVAAVIPQQEGQTAPAVVEARRDRGWLSGGLGLWGVATASLRTVTSLGGYVASLLP